jgi:histidinol-phosphate aminotransferase
MNLSELVPSYIRTLTPYVPGKPIEETKREYRLKRVVKLASNENPLGPSPKAIAALRKTLSELHRYPDGSGFELKSALLSRLAADSSSKRFTREQITLGNGSNEIIDLAIRTYCRTGDRIVTSKAAFIAYRLCAQIHGVETIETDLTPGLEFDLQAILEKAKNDSKVKLVFIANPNNPTGTYVKDSELRAFLSELQKIRNGSVLAVLDYAYWEYVTANDLSDPLELLEVFPQTLVLRTFSKIYGLAGLRMGYGLADAEIIASLEKVRQPFNINSAGLIAAEAALSDQAFVKKARKANSVGMKVWEKNLKALGVPFWKSQGNFLLIDALAGFGMSGVEIYEKCLRKGVILRPVANYGIGHALRISVGTSEENRFAFRTLADARKTSRTHAARS